MPPAISQADAAKMLNVSERSVQRAQFVREHGTPEEVAQVVDGEKTVSAAEKEIRERRLPSPRVANEKERDWPSPLSTFKCVAQIIIHHPRLNKSLFGDFLRSVEIHSFSNGDTQFFICCPTQNGGLHSKKPG